MIYQKRPQNGFTLLEAMIVVGLLAVVVAILLPAFFGILQKYRAETAVEQVVMNLRFARLAAIKKRVPYKVLFFDNSSSPPNTYKMQLNPSKDNTTWDNYTLADTSIPSNLTILSGGISEVTFSPRGAATITGGTNLRIQSQTYIYRINVYPTGAVTKVAE
jgi:prepilin-type N-terminal cleavage/methylation domain-containing protein